MSIVSPDLEVTLVFVPVPTPVPNGSLHTHSSSQAIHSQRQTRHPKTYAEGPLLLPLPLPVLVADTAEAASLAPSAPARSGLASALLSNRLRTAKIIL